MTMTKGAKKAWNVVAVIAGVVALSLIVQTARYWNQVKGLKQGEAVSLPNNYFPFQGNYTANAQGKIMKA